MKALLILLFSLMTTTATTTHSIYDFKVKGLEGGTIDFAAFKGKNIMIVNTASQCGFTPQYAGLQELYTKYQGKLVIVGFPSNDFGAQEPGTAEQIHTFCSRNYGVTFPMAEKVVVVGKDAAPIYKFLTSKALNGTQNADVKWNFTKFLFDEHGKMLGVFPSRVEPMDQQITSLIEK